MARKLKIAVWSNLPTGGARRALHDHVKGLTERGHAVECFRPPVPSPEWMAMPATEHEIPLKSFSDDTSYVGRVLKHVARSTLSINAMKAHSDEVARQISEGGFDILFANTCFQFHSPFIGRAVSGIPKLLYLQEPNRFLYEALPTLPWIGAPEGASWRRVARSWFDLFALRNQARQELANAKSFDRILVNSHFSKESVARAYNLNAKVCYLGVDSQRFVLGSEPRENFVLGVGAIAPTKRVDLAIRSVGSIKVSRPKLVWIGNFSDETYAASLTRTAKDLEVEFEMRRLVSDEELVKAYQKAGCVIYVPRLEPFGYVPIEALACGAHVIGANEGGIRETLTAQNGTLVESDPKEIGQSIVAALAQNHSSNHSLETLSKWSLEAATDRLESHLRDLCS